MRDRMRILCQLIAVANLGACGGSSETPSPSATPSDATVDTSPSGGETGANVDSVSDAATSTADCLVDPRAVGTVPTNGPYFHSVRLATSSDQITFTPGATDLLTRASVPDAVYLPDGRVRIYYVSGEPGYHSVWVASSTDGKTFSEKTCITIDGKVDPQAVDPDVVLMPDGTYRLTYYANFPYGGPPPSDGGGPPKHSIRVASSTDGVRFTSATEIISSEQGTDPTAVRLTDGSWVVAVMAGAASTVYNSTDGKTFTSVGSISASGTADIRQLSDGSIEAVLSGASMKRFTSGNKGVTWTETTPLALSGGGGHPTWLKRPSGWDLYFVHATDTPTKP